jgi:hypothetical protein
MAGPAWPARTLTAATLLRGNRNRGHDGHHTDAYDEPLLHHLKTPLYRRRISTSISSRRSVPLLVISCRAPVSKKPHEPGSLELERHRTRGHALALAVLQHDDWRLVLMGRGLLARFQDKAMNAEPAGCSSQPCR